MTADADAVSDAMLDALASLIRRVAGETPDPDEVSVAKLEAFADSFAQLCTRAASGLRRGEDDAVDRAANGAVPFAFYAVADAGVGVVVATQSWAGAVAGVGGFWKDFWKHIRGFWKDRGQPRARRRGQTRGGHYRGCHRQGRGRGDAQLCCIVGG